MGPVEHTISRRYTGSDHPKRCFELSCSEMTVLSLTIKRCGSCDSHQPLCVYFLTEVPRGYCAAKQKLKSLLFHADLHYLSYLCQFGKVWECDLVSAVFRAKPSFSLIAAIDLMVCRECGGEG